MLASLTPLGERSRGSSWRLTATAFGLGALMSGAVAGAIAAGAGSLIPGSEWRGAAAAMVLVCACVFEATRLRARLPSSRRQVNENWLGRYRGWVYGAGYGAQLGVGVATIVTSAAVYAAALLAFICGRPVLGALIGGSFGATRAASILPAAAVHDALSLARLHRRVLAIEPSVRRAAAIAQVALAAVVSVLVV